MTRKAAKPPTMWAVQFPVKDGFWTIAGTACYGRADAIRRFSPAPEVVRAAIAQ